MTDPGLRVTQACRLRGRLVELPPRLGRKRWSLTRGRWRRGRSWPVSGDERIVRTSQVFGPLPEPPTGLAVGFGREVRPTAKCGFTPNIGGSPVRHAAIGGAAATTSARRAVQTAADATLLVLIAAYHGRFSLNEIYLRRHVLEKRRERARMYDRNAVASGTVGLGRHRVGVGGDHQPRAPRDDAGDDEPAERARPSQSCRGSAVSPVNTPRRRPPAGTARTAGRAPLWTPPRNDPHRTPATPVARRRRADHRRSRSVTAPPLPATSADRYRRCSCWTSVRDRCCARAAVTRASASVAEMNRPTSARSSTSR